jgi:type I restriction enzyme S subunit
MSEWQKVFDKNIRAYISLINEFLLKNEWQNVEVGSILIKDTQKIKDAVLAKNYLKEGKFKIVSQSKDLFSGYSDDESLLNELTKPVIIFGDHTQIVKYIDFPFVLGADGVKVLEPSEEYETKFFYYLLKAIDLNSNKYARHFSLLRKARIPFKKNSLELQNLITSYLSDFEKNTLSEKTYFDFETEEKIKNLHISNIKVGTLLDESSNQQTYLTQLRQAILQEAIEGKLTADWRVKNPVQKGNPGFQY